jgi:hypothetical protein
MKETNELEVVITGAQLAHLLNRAVIPTLLGDKYLFEVSAISRALLENDKTWEDIDELFYVPGMRVPYHLRD